MSLKGRIRALERRAGPPGVCSQCRGQGEGAWVVVHSPDDPGKPTGGCPRCGEISYLKMWVIELADGEELPV